MNDNRRVNLFGVGAPRTATSSLAAMLAATRQVFVPKEKEVNGFGIIPELTEALYDQRFSGARKQHRYIADISPVYLSNERVPERIKSYNPDARIIVTLREPVSRIVSQYSHMRLQVGDPSLAGDLRLDVDAYIRKGLADLQTGTFGPDSWFSAALNVTHSFYGRHLGRYLECFAREQILVLVYEDLLRPRRFWQRGQWHKDLRSFLDVKVSERRVWENRATDERLAVAQDLVAELRGLFAPEIRIAAEFIGRDLSAVWGY